MSRLPRPTPEDLTPEQGRLYDEIVGGPRARGPQRFALATPDGRLNGPFNAYLHAPEVGRHLQRLGAALRFETQLSAREREMSILLVAAEWGSAFERHAHEPLATDAGVTEAELSALRSGGLPEDLEKHEEAVLAFVARILVRPVRMSDEEYLSLTRDLGDRVVAELIALVGYYSAIALQMEVLDIRGES